MMIALVTMGSTVSLRLSQITLLVRADNDGGQGRQKRKCVKFYEFVPFFFAALMVKRSSWKAKRTENQ